MCVTSRFVTARLIHSEALSASVSKLLLQLPEAVPFAAGQYLQLCLTNGERRAYSIASTPGQRDLELHIGSSERDPETLTLIDQLQQSGEAQLELPLGNAWLRHGPEPLLIVAGGSGFSYAKSLIEQSLITQPERAISLYWGGRNRDALYLHELAKRWANDHPHFRYLPVLDEAPPGWQGLQGRVHEAVVRHEPALATHAVYVAGPFAMAAAARSTFFAAGLPAHQLFGDAYAFI